MTVISEPPVKHLDQQQAAELSRDLHQAAQPLTVLQGCLELALARPHTAEEYKYSIERALDESRRLSACFDRIRDLVRSSPTKSERMYADAASKRSKAPRVADSKRIGCLHV